jgi:hypothetical protein
MAGTECSEKVSKRLKNGYQLDVPQATKVRAMVDASRMQNVVRREV